MQINIEHKYIYSHWHIRQWHEEIRLKISYKYGRESQVFGLTSYIIKYYDIKTYRMHKWLDKSPQPREPNRDINNVDNKGSNAHSHGYNIYIYIFVCISWNEEIQMITKESDKDAFVLTTINVPYDMCVSILRQTNTNIIPFWIV